MSLNLQNILTKIEPYVDSDIANDIVSFLYIENKEDIFSNRLYTGNIGFNKLLEFTSEHADIFRIYTGFLGNGEYIHIYFHMLNGYSIEFSDFSGNHTVHCKSACWHHIKKEVDDYFLNVHKHRQPLNNSLNEYVLYDISYDHDSKCDKN
jgi:hypothetical protein